MRMVQPHSVVDVGCGCGAWLSVFRSCGVDRILGIDGHHIDSKWLEIPAHDFQACDLTRPFQLDQTFDLALCLEVAEHVPARASSSLVQSLAQLAPVILFSAAVPQQGGVNHINEQWPSYWRRLFERQQFRMLDLIRKEIWLRPEVKFWYRQNMFLFVREDIIAGRPIFLEATKFADDLLLVHSSVLERQWGLRSMAKHLPTSISRAVKFLMLRASKSR